MKKLNDRDGFFKQIRESLTTLASEVSTAECPAPAEHVNEESDDIQEPDHKKRKISPFDWFQSAAPDKPVVKKNVPAAAVGVPVEERVLAEIWKYDFEVAPGCASPGEFDPLQWWGEREDRFPLLSCVAKLLMVIPPSSAECERHFSAFNARHIITCQRNSMFPETVQALSIVLEGYKNKLLK